ncbi:hypothetical protein ABC2120 [Shouchella clausii KSM-K16]|uniref:Uncharacterized protein n=1 Tax=Shouchella clausii (strain KSM-K16) TaxID=66692 RepID=Q5WG50_SHOC1|nr:hypothetical protein ABC2120 [Shouchella clausii KSM-K16]
MFRLIYHREKESIPFKLGVRMHVKRFTRRYPLRSMEQSSRTQSRCNVYCHFKTGNRKAWFHSVQLTDRARLRETNTPLPTCRSIAAALNGFGDDINQSSINEHMRT